MSLSDELLAMLRCPRDRSTLKRATRAELDAIAAVRLAQDPSSEPLKEALVREDKRLAYPIVEGIALLNDQDAIDLS